MRITFLEASAVQRRRSFGSLLSVREMTCPAGPRPGPSAGQAKESAMITANVGGQLGLDAYLCECIASDVLLVQETRIPASPVEPTEARLRQIG
eukprot:5425544-Pyramimonas_sp.AAC.1